MVKILNGSIQNTITILRQWYLMLTHQGCSGNSSLHLEDFRDHSFDFLKEFFSTLGLKEHNLRITPVQKLTINVFVNATKKRSTDLFENLFCRFFIEIFHSLTLEVELGNFN